MRACFDGHNSTAKLDDPEVDPIQLWNGFDKILTARQGNDALVWSPNQLKQFRTWVDRQYPETRPDHLVPVSRIRFPLPSRQQFGAMAMTFMLVCVFQQALPPHMWGKNIKPKAALTTLQLPVPPSPFYNRTT